MSSRKKLHSDKEFISIQKEAVKLGKIVSKAEREMQSLAKAVKKGSARLESLDKSIKHKDRELGEIKEESFKIKKSMEDALEKKRKIDANIAGLKDRLDNILARATNVARRQEFNDPEMTRRECEFEGSGLRCPPIVGYYAPRNLTPIVPKRVSMKRADAYLDVDRRRSSLKKAPLTRRRSSIKPSRVSKFADDERLAEAVTKASRKRTSAVRKSSSRKSPAVRPPLTPPLRKPKN